MFNKISFSPSVQHARDTLASGHGPTLNRTDARNLRHSLQRDKATLSSFDEDPKYDKALGQKGYVELNEAGLDKWAEEHPGTTEMSAEFSEDSSAVRTREVFDGQEALAEITDEEYFQAHKNPNGSISTEVKFFNGSSVEVFDGYIKAEKSPRPAARGSRPQFSAPSYEPPTYESQRSVSSRYEASASEERGTNWGRVLTGIGGGDRASAIEAKYGKMPFYVKMMAGADSTSDELASVVRHELRKRGDFSEVDPYDGAFFS